ncbi:MAG TPA: hypothetical protein VK849_14510 [Longimicrobiales bacterium]|nr:hypothetical protein [Longimicrobiales bacterium]
MRRGPDLIAAALVVAGLELSTEAVSLVAVRLRTGVLSFFTGTDFYVSEARFGFGVLLLFLGVLLGVLVLWARVEKRAANAVGRSCPKCGRTTKRVKRSEWERLASTLSGAPLARRQCDDCGWMGLSGAP